VHVHGRGGGYLDNLWTWQLAAAAADAGWLFITGNHRGTAVLSAIDHATDPEGRRVGAAVELIAESPLDIAAWCSLVPQSCNRIVLSGHSLGASKVVLAARQHVDPRIAGLALLAPADMVALTQAHPATAELLPLAHAALAEGKPLQLLDHSSLWAPVSAQTIVEIATRNSPGDIINGTSESDSLSDLNLPILMILGENDDCLVPSKPGFGLDNLAASVPKDNDVRTAVVPNSDHQFRPNVDFMTHTMVDWLTKLEALTESNA
jgi:pimeloyl-ACP methyl ester carboxylesterase